MRKYKRPLIRLAAIVLLLAIGAAVAWQLYVRPWQQFCSNAKVIQIALERYAMDHDYSYPDRIAALIEKGYLKEWPPNPLDSGTMQPLAPDSEPVPGGFVYVRSAPSFSSTDGNSKAGHEVKVPGWISITEIDYYEIVFYGRGCSQRFRYLASKGQGIELPKVAQVHKQIHWDKVAIVIDNSDLVGWAR